MWMNKAKAQMKKQKISLRVFLSFYLIFSLFQPGVTYKSVAHNKKRVFGEFKNYIVTKNFPNELYDVLSLACFTRHPKTKFWKM